MWPFKKRSTLNAAKNLPGPVIAAILVSVVSLCVAAGVARWSWLLLDEQVQLRKDFVELKNHTDQTDIQYEAWLAKLKQERVDAAKAAATVKK
ncbi:MAG: hypothetical protein RLZZ324_926 [Candidatus Parcubacteria bacterium]|jgi:hypothetical protein